MAQTPSPYDLSAPDEAQLQALANELGPEERRVLLNQGTEPPFCGGLLDNHEDGCYVCRLCALPLFSSACKFESGSGWPSFYAPYHPDHIRLERSDWPAELNVSAPHHPSRHDFYGEAARLQSLPPPEFTGGGEGKTIDGSALCRWLNMDYTVTDWFQWLGQRKPSN